MPECDEAGCDKDTSRTIRTLIELVVAIDHMEDEESTARALAVAEREMEDCRVNVKILEAKFADEERWKGFVARIRELDDRADQLESSA